jgi:hypothetical protein
MEEKKLHYPVVTTEKNKKLFEIDESNIFMYKRDNFNIILYNPFMYAF